MAERLAPEAFLRRSGQRTEPQWPVHTHPFTHFSQGEGVDNRNPHSHSVGKAKEWGYLQFCGNMAILLLNPPLRGIRQNNIKKNSKKGG